MLEPGNLPLNIFDAVLRGCKFMKLFGYKKCKSESWTTENFSFDVSITVLRCAKCMNDGAKLKKTVIYLKILMCTLRHYHFSLKTVMGNQNAWMKVQITIFVTI